MPRNKATHQGTCQVCGHFQKLPGGVLSLHGYEVKWNCFNGMCWGARHQPFELAKDLIEKAIKDATADAKRIEASAVKLEGDANPDKVWLHQYRMGHWGRGGRSGYYWKEYDASAITFDGIFMKAPTGEEDKDGNEKVRQSAGSYKTHQDLNKAYARDLRQRVGQLRRYVSWQKERITDWQPHPEKLIAVVPPKPLTAAEASAKLKQRDARIRRRFGR